MTVDPVAAARALLARLDIRAPREIKIELIAYHSGALVLYRASGSADARVVRSGGRAILAIAKEAKGTPRARFSTAHEVGHNLMHPDHDAIAVLHGAPRAPGRDHRAEYEADRFASELLAPTAFAAPLCANATPTLDAVSDLAREFDVSLSVAARKWAELARTRCAYVESRGDVITRVVRSEGLPGGGRPAAQAVRGDARVREMGRAGGEWGRRVHDAGDAKWGSSLVEGDVIEECVTLGDGSAGGRVLTWLWHA